VRKWFSAEVSKRSLPSRIRLDEEVASSERLFEILEYPAYQLTPKSEIVYHRAPLAKGAPRTIAAITTCEDCQGEQYLEFELGPDGMLLGLNVHTGGME